MAKILIIDDRPLNRQFLTTLLGYGNHELREASDGVEGLQAARDQHSDLIISDVLMPTMDGYEFVRRLREDADIGKTPVIFSTAHYLSRESRALANKCGVTSIIYKPSEPQEVLDIVAAALGEQQLQIPAKLPQPQEFDREHLRLVTNKVSEKANQLRDSHEKLTALIELSTDLAQERDPVQLLDRICSVAREIIGARWTMVVLLEPNRKTVQHLRVAGIELQDVPGLRSALLENGVFKTVTQEGRTICLSDVTSTPLALRLPEGLPRAASLLVAPLVMRGHVDGWICLADKLGLDAFTEEDEQLAPALAGQMAVAYANARLYSDSLQYAGKLEREIAQRAGVERQLGDSRAQLAGIIGTAMDSIVTVDSDQRIVMFNTAAEKMFLCTSAEVMGQPLDRFIPTRFRSKHSQAIQKFGETGVATGAWAATRSVSGVRSDGEEFPVEASMSQIEVGGQKLSTVIMRDIGEQARALAALRASELRYRRLFESAKDGILILAADSGEIVEVNPFLLDMLGYAKEDLIGKELWQLGLFTDVLDSKAAFLELQEQGYIRYEDLPLKTRDGVIKQVEFVSNRYLVGGGFVIQCNIRDISERKQAADALAESENRLRSILEAEPECVKLVGADGSLIDMNPAGLTMIEADSLEEVLGENVCQLVRPEHQEAFIEVNRRVFAGESATLEFEITGIKGTRRWLEMHATPFRNKDNTIIAALGITRDITERRRVEEARRESEARYRALFEYAPDGILIADAAGRYLDANASICRMLGYAPDELIGRHSSDVVAPMESEHIEGTLTALKDNSDHHREWELRRKDGSDFGVDVMATKMPDGNILAMIRDITARKESEKRIEHLNRVYAVLSEINQMIVRTRDPQTMFANACNIAVEQGAFRMAWIGLLDNESQTIKPQAWAGIDEGYLGSLNTHLRNEAIGLTATAVRDGRYVVVNDVETDPRVGPWRGDFIKRGYQSGAAFPLKVDGQAIGNFTLYSGELGFFNDEEVRLLDDLTMDLSFALEAERRQQERNTAETLLRSKSEELAAMTAQLWQASKLATMGELAASIAHELNNPLATVSLRAEALLMQMSADSDQRKPLEIITHEVDRMASLVNNLLQFTRRSHRQITTVDVCEEIEKSAELVHYHLRSHNIEVIHQFVNPLPTIHADRQQLCQLFLNLLTNASDAMPQGGTLTIRATSNGAHDCVAIDFTDSGEGIAAANLEKIWEPFFTTKPEGKGTGLGLAICRRIVEEHGGTISISSQIGEGTTVSIILPRTDYPEVLLPVGNTILKPDLLVC